MRDVENAYLHAKILKNRKDGGGAFESLDGSS